MLTPALFGMTGAITGRTLAWRVNGHESITRRLVEQLFNDELFALRSRAHQDHAPKNRRAIQCHLRRDHCSERKPQNVSGFQTKAVQECQRVRLHARHGFRHLPTRGVSVPCMKISPSLSAFLADVEAGRRNISIINLEIVARGF